MEGLNLVVMTEDQLNGIIGKLDQIENKLLQLAVNEKGKKLSAEEAVEYLGIEDKGTLYAWARQGKIPHKKVGSRVFFDSKELDDWMSRPVVERT